MVAGLTPSQTVRGLSEVRLTNLSLDAEALRVSRERTPVNATTEARNVFTIGRLERNLSDILETQERTPGIGRGSLLDIQV